MAAKFQSAVIALFLVCSASAGASSWKWKYRVLRSAHFELIYREDQKALAKRYIVAAEQAHELVFPIFKEGPSKTIIVLQDDTDNANGSADFLPYPHITIYPVLPSTLDSIDEFGDWPLEMMVHEYTHILNMYPAHGIYVPLKYIFGSVMRPNAVLPRWYLEGLAVNLETALTDFGRLRSPDTQASARALALDKRFSLEELPRIGESSIPTWPYGSRPYLYGGWWWETVQMEKGYSVIETWNQNYSRRLPFLLNGPMREQTGKSAEGLLKATTERVEARANAQLAVLKASNPHVTQVVAAEGGEQATFALSPSGDRLLYWVGNPGFGSQAKVKFRAQSGEEFKNITGLPLFKSAVPLRVRWIDDNRVVFDQLNQSVPYVTYRDLYTYDFKTNQMEPLTNGARAQEGSPNPSASEVAFIQNDGGRNRLALVNLQSKEIRPLVNGSFSQRLSGPEFLNDKEILFVVRERNGEEDLRVFNLETKKISAFDSALKNTQNPRKTAKGVLVSDAATGVRNIYWLHDGKSEPVSNTLTAIETADYDPQRQELIISEMTTEGRRLRTLPFAVFQPPTIEKPQWPAPPKISTNKVAVRDESYIPLAYMLPRYWLPFLYQVEGGYIMQGTTGTQDPAGRNSYSLVGSYDTVTKKGSYGAAYVNSSLPSDIGLSYGKSYSYLGASALTVESQSAALTFSQYWPFNSRDTRWKFGGIWIDTESTFRQLGPTLNFTRNKLNNPQNQWYGYQFSVTHTEYLKQANYLAYGRSYAHVTQSLALGGGHKLWLQTRASVAPRLPFGLTTLLGDRNVGGNYLVNLANSEFLLRGYPSGQFVGRKVVNANLEYVLPAARLDRGWGTFPVYLQALEIAAFADTMAVDGGGFDPKLSRYVRRNLGQFHTGAGAELRLNSTAGYHLPVSLTVGLYYGFNTRFGGGFSPFVGFGIGDIGGLQDKKH